MKIILQLFTIALLLFFSSCSSSKKISSPATAAVANSSDAAPGASDGSSFEKAIVVKSINAEYAYVKKVCPDCTFKKQALRQNNKKYYDVLYFDNNGTEVVYYFDINSFFGKTF
jgi:glutaredoxin